MKRTIYMVPFFILSVCCISAQEDKTFLQRILQEDSATVEALALYPKDVRETIYKACSYPEVLVHMSNRQKDTKEQFKKLLSPYNREEQQKIWNLSAYPGLIEKLAAANMNTRDDREKIVMEYPKEIQETALFYGEKEPALLVSIQNLNEEVEKSFETIIQNYPNDAKTAFRELLRLPEVVGLLTGNMKLAVETGDVYKRNPELLSRQMDSLNLLLASENAKNLEDWKKGLNENPEASKELQESGKEYAKEKGYKEDETRSTETIVVTNYIYRPYSWWFGYPWWYDYPYWYPYSYWHDLGFYTGPGGGIVVIGLPSPHFVHWHFHHPHHHYYYPHLSDYYLGYYYGKRRSATGLNTPVRQWIRENETRLPGNYLHGDKERPARLKELGDFEMNLDKQRKTTPAKIINREEYLHENKKLYPSLSTPARSPEIKPVQVPVHQPRSLDQPKQKQYVPAPPQSKPVYPPKQKMPAQIIPKPKREKPTPAPQVKPAPMPKLRPSENKSKPAKNTVPSRNTP